MPDNGVPYLDLIRELGITGSTRGAKQFVGKCPFHNDSNPSFGVSLETGLYSCFSCRVSGDFVALVRHVLGYDPRAARDWIQGRSRDRDAMSLGRKLALRLGLVPGELPLPEPENWRVYYDSLSNRVMPLWFLERGFTWTTVNAWGIRYDPVGDAVVVPVNFVDGHMVGYVKRNQDPSRPKYENNKGLPRSKLLFGLDRVNSARIIVTEGVLDTIWLQQNGYAGVAPMGVGQTRAVLSREQVMLLQKGGYKEIYLALDNDSAGLSATYDMIFQLYSAGWAPYQIKIINIPYDNNKKDVQDCNPETLHEIFNNPEPSSSVLRKETW